MAHQLPLPNIVRQRAESLGEQGRQWVSALGRLVESLESLWSLQIGKVRTGGSESLVVEVIQQDGSGAILKIGLPGPADLAVEARVYRLANGRGYARLIEHDDLLNSLLLEKLGPPLASKKLSTDEQVAELCSTLDKAWVPLDSASGLMTGAEKAEWLVAFISQKWLELDQPCSRKAIDRALQFAEERVKAHCAENSVLVHGDAHALNALAVTDKDGTHYKFVDPDGLYAERACDLAVPMRDWNQELLAGDTMKMAHDRCELLSELTAVDATSIWQWGFIERVSTGLVLKEIGQVNESQAYLKVADITSQSTKF